MTSYKKYKYRKKYGTQKTSYSLGKKYKYNKSKGRPYKTTKKTKYNKSKGSPYKTSKFRQQIYKDLKGKPRFTYKKPKTFLGKYAFKKIVKPYTSSPKKRKLMMETAEDLIFAMLTRGRGAMFLPAQQSWEWGTLADLP